MKYRILHIINSLNMGGAENFIMNIYRKINRAEIQFDFLVHKKDYFDQEVEALGGKIYYLDGYVNECGIIKYKTQIKDFFESEEGKKYKVVHVHVNQTSGLIIPIIKKTSGAICFSHSHDLQNYNNVLVSAYKKYLQILLNKYTDYRLACSYPAGNWLYNAYPFWVINNGIDMAHFSFSLEQRGRVRKELGIPENVVLIGHVGRFEAIKNQKFLVDLYQKQLSPDKYRLLLIGEGSLKEEVKSRIEAAGLTQYIYVLPATSELVRYYDAMDIFVLPSIKEALGIVGVEAQANGLPVLASTGVASEMKVSKNVEFADLDYSLWNEQIERFRKMIFEGRIERKDVEINQEYDIKRSAEKLVELYDEGVTRYENMH